MYAWTTMVVSSASHDRGSAACEGCRAQPTVQYVAPDRSPGAVRDATAARSGGMGACRSPLTRPSRTPVSSRSSSASARCSRRASRCWSGRATTPPCCASATATWWCPPTCSSRAATSAATGPRRPTSGTAPPPRTSPTSTRWAVRAHSLTIGLAAPRDLPAQWALEFAQGFAEECALVGACVVGGDLTSADALVIAVTVLGSCTQSPVLRSGAEPGDVARAVRAPGLGRGRAGRARPRLPLAAGAGRGLPPPRAAVRRGTASPRRPAPRR